MSFISLVTRRFLMAVRQERFLTFLSCISIGGIAVSVMAFLIIHAVMNGFSSHLRQVLVGFNAHLEIETEAPAEILKWLEGQKTVKQAQPVTEVDAILETTAEAAGGVRLRGMRPDDLAQSSSLRVTYFEDENADSLSGSEDRLPGLLVGEDLYARLKFIPGEAEGLRLVNPVGDVGPEGELNPLSRSFRVIGVFSTGFFDYDNQYVLGSLSEAGRLKGGGEPRLLVSLTELNETQTLRKQLEQQWPELKISTWTEKNKRLFSALKLERRGMGILLGMVTLIACFNVLALVTLLSLSRRREVALFEAMGLPRVQVHAIFSLIGLTLGAIGTVLGFVAGGLVLGWLQGHPLPLPPAYYLDTLPVKTDTATVIVIVLLGPVFAWVASLWPAWAAGRLEITALLRES